MLPVERGGAFMAAAGATGEAVGARSSGANARQGWPAT